MRAHQAFLRELSLAQLNRVDDGDKYSFMATFTGDDETFSKVRKRYDSFIKECESLTENAKQKAVYQLNFDFFKWL
jgi:TnpA family transposase